MASVCCRDRIPVSVFEFGSVVDCSILSDRCLQFLLLYFELFISSLFLPQVHSFFVVFYHRQRCLFQKGFVIGSSLVFGVCQFGSLIKVFHVCLIQYCFLSWSFSSASWKGFGFFSIFQRILAFLCFQFLRNLLPFNIVSDLVQSAFEKHVGQERDGR